MNLIGITDHDFIGSEFDWIAQDMYGNFGYFSTAGEGWIPEAVLANPEPYWDSLDFVRGMPIAGEPEVTFSGNHVIGDWLEVAARGLYAFDWNRGTKRYELVAKPTVAIGEAGKSIIEELARGVLLPCSFSKDFASRGPTK